MVWKVAGANGKGIIKNIKSKTKIHPQIDEKLCKFHARKGDTQKMETHQQIDQKRE